MISRWNLATGCVALAALFGGCAGSRVDRSAAEAVGANADQPDLDFFDILEKRPLACQDDLLHGVLLLSPGGSPATFDERVTEAKELGLIAADARPRARAGLSVGEAAACCQRAVTGTGGADAVAWAQGRGFVKANAIATDPVSGAELLAALQHLHEAVEAAAAAGHPILVRRPDPAGLDAVGLDPADPANTPPASPRQRNNRRLVAPTQTPEPIN